MKVLLVNPPWVYKRLYTHGIYPPYGLLMVATLLREAGHDATILDLNAFDMEELEAREAVAAADWDAIGITTFTDTFAFLESFGAWLKQEFPERPIVLGGPLVSGTPEVVTRAAQADVSTLDEAFGTVVQLFDTLERGGDLSEVNGILYRDPADPQVLRKTRPREAWDPLDSLPLPDWELLSVETYLAGGPNSYQRKRKLPRYLSTITSLGCPYKCTFCQVPVMFDGVRLRSPESITAELQLYKDRYAVQSMYFRDDILFRPKKISRALEDAQLDLQWSCLLRADMMNEATLSAMKAGGCAQIRVGFESGSDDVLTLIKKQTEVSDNVRCIELADKAGIDISGFLMVGLPGETEASLANTLRFVEEAGARASVHFPLPLPGTPMYRDALATGQVVSEPWLLRRFSEPQLPGQVLQPPPVNFTDLPERVLVEWAARISDAARGLSTGFSDAA